MRISDNQSLILGPPGCVDKDTEYLSPAGWKRISEYVEGEVCQYDLKTGVSTFVEPLNYISEPCEQMFHIKTKYGLDQMLSFDHRVLWYSKSHGKTTGPFTTKAIDLYKESRRIKYPIMNIPTSFIPPEREGVNLTDEELRLMVAVIADGSFGYKDLSKGRKKVVIHIKKQRKKDRLERLLADAEIPYKIYVRPNHGGFSDYIFLPPVRTKKFDSFWWNCTNHQLQVIAKELVHWDGHIRGGNKGDIFSTSVKETADFAQYAYNSVGLTTRILTDERGSVSLEHTVVTSDKTVSGIFGGTVYLDNFKIVPTEDGKMYCFEVPTSYLVLRRNGCVFITGNCGKTTNVLNKIDELLQAGESPDRIAFVSFTKKAIAEATGRAGEKFSLKPKQLPMFKTVHAMCFAALGIGKNDVVGKEHYRELGEWLGYRFEGTWDEAEGVPIGSEKGDTLLFLDNLARITQRPLREVWEENYHECEWEELERFQEGYQDFKSSKYIMDFTDMLSAYVAMCDSSPARQVIVDEAQDLSSLQWSVLKHAYGNVKQTIIAGDDDQSIYKWSGADVNAFLSLEGDKTILSQSYRLPRSVYDIANGIVNKIENRFDKPFDPRNSEGEVNFLNSLEEVILNDESTLFLVRNTYLGKRVQDYMHRMGIPYTNKYGYSSVRSAHIKAIECVEKLRKAEKVTGAEVKAMYDSMRVGEYLARGFKVKVANIKDTDLFDFTTLRNNFGLLDVAPWQNVLSGIGDDLITYYQRLGANGYGLSAAPKCSISTIHAAKGGEADHVVLLSDMAYRSYQEYVKQPDNERRVAYVGVTRAKEKLTIVLPSSKLYYDYYGESQ